LTNKAHFVRRKTTPGRFEYGLNHGFVLQVFCFCRLHGDRWVVQQKMQEVVRFFLGSMQTEVSESKTELIGSVNWPWAAESALCEKWVETETSENANYCQFGTKSS